MTGPGAAAIDNIQRLARIGQRDHERMIAPLAFVVDVHAALALAGRLDHRTVGFEDRFVEEFGRLLSPDFHANFVEYFLQRVDVLRGQPTTEVAGGGRVSLFHFDPGRRAPSASR